MEGSGHSSDWDEFIHSCLKLGVPERSVRWYVVRVERYLRSPQGLEAGEDDAKRVADYVASAGRHPQMEPWKFRQLVHALEIYFVHVRRVDWAKKFDWQYWRDSARGLDRDHPTVARHNNPIRAAVPAKALEGSQAAQSASIDHRLVAEIRRRNYSIRTEHAYLNWAQRYLAFHQHRAPEQMGSAEIAAYLSHLALNLEVSANTQHQALCALVFLHEQVLAQKIGSIAGLVAAKKPRRLPSVLTRVEVRSLLENVTQAPFDLMAGLLYGTGMRLMECIRLRVKDADFGYSQIIVRDGKGQEGSGSSSAHEAQRSVRGAYSVCAVSALGGSRSRFW